MASSPEFLDYVRDQLRAAGPIAHRRMFGEYAIYLDEKVVGLICDDQLYVKPTDAGRALLESPREAFPFPGARPWFLVSGELDDPDLMAQLIRATARELPPPKPRPLPKAARKSARRRPRGNRAPPGASGP